MGVIDKQYTLGDDTQSTLRSGASVYKIGQQLTTSRGGIIDQIDLKIRKTGTPTGNVWVEIWSDTGANLPSAQLNSDSVTVDVSTLSTDAGGAWQSFVWNVLHPVILPNIKYWVVFNGDYAESGVNCAQWRVDTDSSGGEANPGAAATATNADVWSDAAGNDYLFKQYSRALSDGLLNKYW